MSALDDLEARITYAAWGSALAAQQPPPSSTSSTCPTRGSTPHPRTVTTCNSVSI